MDISFKIKIKLKSQYDLFGRFILFNRIYFRRVLVLIYVD